MWRRSLALAGDRCYSAGTCSEEEMMRYHNYSEFAYDYAEDYKAAQAATDFLYEEVGAAVDFIIDDGGDTVVQIDGKQHAVYESMQDAIDRTYEKYGV